MEGGRDGTTGGRKERDEGNGGRNEEGSISTGMMECWTAGSCIATYRQMKKCRKAKTKQKRQTNETVREIDSVL